MADDDDHFLVVLKSLRDIFVYHVTLPSVCALHNDDPCFFHCYP